MNPQTFLSNFGHVANAPDGVKSLRQLVMASALAGKFSVPNEELPSDIPTRLEEARSLHFRSLGKREKPLLFGASLIQEFEIPTGWQWVRVGQICDLQTGATPSTQKPEYWGGEIPWLASGDVNRREIFECAGRITEEGLANSNCKVLPKNAVLIALNGQGKTRATVALLRIPAACNQSLVAMIPFDVRIITPEYIFLSLRYRYYEIRDVTGQDQRRGLNMGLVSDLSVPLAPLAEQKRIVAKVDELMALCDQLEAQQQERERRFPVLSRTCHARFAEAPTPANLNRIFDETGSVSPDDLRKSILSLAVRGRLVSQDSKDESVADCSKTPSARRLQPISSDELPFSLPRSWQWCRLGSVAQLINGDRGKNYPNKAEYVRAGLPFINTGHIEPDGTLSLATMHYITRAKFDSLRSGKIQDGDLVYCLRGATIGKTAIVTQFKEGAVASSLVIIRLNEKLLPRYAYYFLISPAARALIKRFDNGSAQPNLAAHSVKLYVTPVPPLAEQHRIVAKVDELMALVDHLEAQQQERNKLAEAFAKACVASFTGTTQLERPKKMKAPKTELVSLVTLGKKPKPDAKAPLAKLLSQHKGALPAKSLWQQSGLTIDGFYQQLKTEIAQGWIAPPAEAEMKVLEEA